MIKKLIVLIFLISVTAGCQTQCTRGTVDTTDKSHQSVGAHLISAGDWCLWIGVAVLVLGFGLGLAGAGKIIPAAIVRLLPSIGGSGIVVGSSLLWLGEYPWVLGVSIGVSVVAFALHHRDDIRKWLHIGTPTQPTIQTPQPIKKEIP